MRLMGGKIAKAGAKPQVRRRKAAPRWLRPARNAAIVLSLCAVVIGGPVWLYIARPIHLPRAAFADLGGDGIRAEGGAGL